MMKKIILILTLFPQVLFAQNCLSGWSWYRPLTVYNSGTDAVIDASIPFDLNTSIWVGENKLQADGSDLRITDESCNPIPFFMDSAANATGNVIWIKLPSIPANDSVKLQLYYGKDSVESVTNGEDVFLFYDDFSADSVNPDKWEAIGGYTNFKVVDSIFQYSSNGMLPGPRFKFARTKMSFDETVFFDFRSRISNSNGFGFSSADSTLTRFIFRQSVFGFDTLNQVAYSKDTVSNGYQVNGLFPMIRFPRSEFKNGRIRAGIEDSLLTIDYFANLDDNSVSDSVFQLTQEKMTGFHFIVSSFLGSQTIYLDYLRVRKPTPETVSVVVGEESELSSTGINRDKLDLSIHLYPNPAHRNLTIQGLPSERFYVELINLQGQILFAKEVFVRENEKLELTLPELPEGLYSLSFENNQGARYTKMLMIGRQ
ncbi:MAG: DUF2341 domain-containing protein [Bacteroidetes bacterium]|nr:DUF2341 domain-containing protein [Bacteroidota bacterium]